MKLTFLGTGTSCGVPILGCGCRTCTSADPHDRRMRTSALLATGTGAHILIDCGPDFRTQMLTYAPHVRPDALLVTHIHYDHTGGLDDVRPFSHPDPIEVYCSPSDADGIRHRMPYCFAANPYPGSPRMTLNGITPGTHVTVCGVDVLPLAVRHGQLDILGYRIGRLGYITDASNLPAATINALKGVDTLVINALRLKIHPSHMNLEEALGVIEVINPRRAWLTHLSHDMPPHATASAMLPADVRIAYDGLTVDIQ